jgi:hypothetical protein
MIAPLSLVSRRDRLTSGSQRRQVVFFGDEFQREPVVAVALPGGRWPIREDVALVPAATGAVVLDPQKQQFEVALGGDTTVQRLEEAGPPGTAFEFGAGAEEG